MECLFAARTMPISTNVVMLKTAVMNMPTVLRNLNGCSVEQIRAPPRQNVVPPFTLSILVESDEIMKNITPVNTRGDVCAPSQMNVEC